MFQGVSLFVPHLLLELNGLPDELDLLSAVILLHDGDSKAEVAHLEETRLKD